MLWSEIRAKYTDQWLLIEALEAHSSPDHRRHLDRIAVIEPCSDGRSAVESYQKYHRLYPQREFYYVHTSRKELDIREQQWAGIRYSHAS